MRCKEPVFLQFLADVTETPTDSPTFARDALCGLCGVSSRKQLNTNDLAAGRWQDVKRRFGRWRRGEGMNFLGHPNSAAIMGHEAYRRGCDLEENPFDPEDKSGPYPWPHALWAGGWNSEKNICNHKPQI